MGVGYEEGNHTCISIPLLKGRDKMIVATASKRSLPYKFKEAYIWQHSDELSGPLSIKEEETEPGMTSHCIEIPVQKLDLQHTLHKWDPSQMNWIKWCSYLDGFTNSLCNWQMKAESASSLCLATHHERLLRRAAIQNRS